jgi:hypothetical protein
MVDSLTTLTRRVLFAPLDAELFRGRLAKLRDASKAIFAGGDAETLWAFLQR